MLLDEHGFLDCNPATLSMFLCSSPEDFLGRHPSEYSPPTQADGRSSLEAADDKISTAYKTGSNLFEWTHQRSNGELFPAEVQLVLLKLKEGDVLQATVRDITRRKAAEKSLKSSKAHAVGIIESARDAFVGMDEQGNIIDWNPEAERILGFSKNETLGKSLADTIVPPEFREAHGEGLKHYLETGKHKVLNKHIEITALHKNGNTFPVELSIAPLAGDNSVTFNAFIRDLTERNTDREEIVRSAESLRKSLVGTVLVIAKSVEARDPYTAGHQQRVSQLARSIAQEMRLDKAMIEGIRMGASIHDIGKIHLPAEILSKPAKLSEIEYLLIQAHTQVGYDILKDINFPWPVADIAHQHHERMDGSGYPQGLKGDDICLEARVVAVADVVEAMVTHRPYRAALGIEVALDEIKNGRGKLFDPQVVDACLKLIAENRFTFKT